MRKQIREYAIAWNPKTKQGRIVLRLTDGHRINVPVTSSEEFSSVAAVLRESPIFLYDSGTIGSGWEPVDDNDG